jgi:V-type H+-transporting ATPase proteolipid subunit
MYQLTLQWSTSNKVQSFFGAMGCAVSIVFTTFGAAYGTAKSAGAIFQSGILRPDMLMQNT